jgi:short-subunit dehydrogenase
MTSEDSRTTALITGASAGLGAEFARQLAAQGHNLVLVARDRARLQATAAELEQRYGIRAEVLSADLTDDGGVAAVVERLTAAERPVGVLVNNAGTGLLYNFEKNDISEEKQHLKLHVETAMELAHAALQCMLERGSGRIINVASVAAFLPRGTYSAAKAWLLSFSRWANLAYGPAGCEGYGGVPRLYAYRVPRPNGHGQVGDPGLDLADCRTRGAGGPG